VKDEIRENLRARLREGGELFPGIVGYEDSVVPRIVNALLARHDFILLGLRGQAKSRILRALTSLLDEAVPVIAGSEVNDDPTRPISAYGRETVEARGDETPIEWIGRDRRYVEKLATPDVTVADLIGDLDPIKAARGGHLLSDELSMHFGLLPRANRGIFAVNELPDLSGKIQVALFNVMEEGDVQIKGFPVRLPLDVLLVFSANPEDYTARGKIITPLKDRIGSEILTHYPRSLEEAEEITRQEAWAERGLELEVPLLVREVIERVAFEAREDDRRVDQRSGVSQRMPITMLEAALSNAERRTLTRGEKRGAVRLADLYAALQAVTGKLELEYEGELEGVESVAEDLVARACESAFDERFDDGDAAPVVEYFEGGGVLQISESAPEDLLLQGFASVPGLLDMVRASAAGRDAEAGGGTPEGAELVAACELVLEGLCARRLISRTASGAYARRRGGAR